MNALPPDFVLPECLDCGACCHSANPRLIALLGADAQTVPVLYSEAAADGSRHMRMRRVEARQCFVCTALGAKNVCQIYAQRPFLCREFERGSPECLQAIADLHGDPAQRIH